MEKADTSQQLLRALQRIGLQGFLAYIAYRDLSATWQAIEDQVWSNHEMFKEAYLSDRTTQQTKQLFHHILQFYTASFIFLLNFRSVLTTSLCHDFFRSSASEQHDIVITTFWSSNLPHLYQSTSHHTPGGGCLLRPSHPIASREKILLRSLWLSFPPPHRFGFPPPTGLNGLEDEGSVKRIWVHAMETSRVKRPPNSL